MGKISNVSILLANTIKGCVVLIVLVNNLDLNLNSVSRVQSPVNCWWISESQLSLHYAEPMTEQIHCSSRWRVCRFINGGPGSPGVDRGQRSEHGLAFSHVPEVLLLLQSSPEHLLSTLPPRLLWQVDDTSNVLMWTDDFRVHSSAIERVERPILSRVSGVAWGSIPVWWLSTAV